MRQYTEIPVLAFRFLDGKPLPALVPTHGDHDDEIG